MPTKYIRKPGSTRGSWSEDALQRAITAVRNGMGINLASRTFNIPSRTLRRRVQNNDASKKPMGPTGSLGMANELKLVAHIKKLQKRGFAPTRDDLRTMAYEFAVELKLNLRFNHEEEKAGYDWLNLFLLRHPDLCVRKAEGVSVARAEGMSREKVLAYFQLLHEILEGNNLFELPGSIWNLDESGLQLNNKVGYVIAQKGSKDVSTITSGEKGETITVIACCNAEGTFLPPACVFKGKYKKDEFQDGMPNGSKIYMNQKSAYVNSDIFLLWLKDHFLPRKGVGKALLIVDGHTSHCSAEVLELAERNDIILLCLPSHTTHYLQPLDRGVFKSLKSAFNKACHLFMKTNPSRKITRLQFGKLLAEAWTKAATNDNAVSSFRATGIFPYNPEAVPEHAYHVSDASATFAIGARPIEDNAIGSNCRLPESESNQSSALQCRSSSPQASSSSVPDRRSKEPRPGPSSAPDLQSPDPRPGSPLVPHQQSPKIRHCSSSSSGQPPSAGKILDNISPLPIIPLALKKRGRNVAPILTLPENIEKAKLLKERLAKHKGAAKIKSVLKPIKKAKKTKPELPSSESDEDFESKEDSDSDINEEFNENECIGCLEDYNSTTRSDDWIRCINCNRWMHENCTKFENKCDSCGKFSRK